MAAFRYYVGTGSCLLDWRGMAMNCDLCTLQVCENDPYYCCSTSWDAYVRPRGRPDLLRRLLQLQLNLIAPEPTRLLPFRRRRCRTPLLRGTLVRREAQMRSFLWWTAPVGALLAVAMTTDCGGETTSPGVSDASTESASGSGSSSSSGGSSSSGAGSSSGSSSSGSSSSGGGSGSSSGSSGTGNCPTCTEPGMLCCNGVDCSVDSQNDPDHCGACNVVCQGATPFCMSGKCTSAPCETDAGGPNCCGAQTCSAGEVCCEFEGPQDYTGCYAYDGGGPRCPPGCPACVSDRNAKRDFEPVDTQDVLERVSRMPITTWSYRSDDASVRHMGMMAQDFQREFGLGSSDKSFHPVDAHGVEMAAIQALYERVKAQDDRIERLELENEELRHAPSCPMTP